MKNVLYITNDVYAYKQGNYYSDWLEVFSNNCNVSIVDSLDSDVDISIFDLIVFGHSFLDMLFEEIKFSNKRILKVIKILKRKELEYILKKHALLQKIKETNIKSIYFSKNDYKNFENKSFFSNYLGVDLFVTHTKNAVEQFVKGGVKAEVLWLPFSISTEKYFQSKDKYFHIGMRANSNKKYNNGERELLYQNIKKFAAENCKADLHLCDNGECFLQGQEYIDWVSSCHLLINSASANGTVGPKFFEGIACNTISLAIENEYEGLLKADEHYLAVKADLSNLEEKIKSFFEDKVFQKNLLIGAKKLLDEHCIENQYSYLIKKV